MDGISDAYFGSSKQYKDYTKYLNDREEEKQAKQAAINENNKRMSTVSDSHYPNNEKNASMRDVSPAYNPGSSQYKKILGISDPTFSGGDVYVAYAEYLKNLKGKVKEAEINTIIDNVVRERTEGAIKSNPFGNQVLGLPTPQVTPAWKKYLDAEPNNISPKLSLDTVNVNNGITTPRQNFENYIYATKPKTKKEVADLIRDNAKYIKDAAKVYGVDPRIVAGVIYTEQANNVNFADMAGDWVGYYGLLDTSIGLGQVKISTAKFIEDLGYIPRTSATEGGWDLPVIGPVHGTEKMAREMRLENNQMNTMYVAAYLKYFQDAWEEQYPAIAGDPVILGTLYNIGHEKTSPNSSPKSIPFGSFVGENYGYMGELLGID